MPAPYNACNAALTGTLASQAVTVGTGTGTPQGTAAGDLVWVLAGCNGSGVTITGVSDSQGNTWAPVIAPGTTTNHLALWVSLTTKALVSGTDTITVQRSSATGAWAMLARGCSGVASATPDKTNSATGNSAAPSSGSSGTLSQAAELVIGGFYNPSAGGAPTAPSFGTALTILQGSYLTEIDEITSATTAQTASATITSAVWAAAIATFPLGVGVSGVTAPLALAAPAGAVTLSSPPPRLPPPAVPLFPDGYGPQPPDFTTWVQDAFGFLTAGIIFRGHQQVAGGQALATGYTVLSLDAVDEDPYGGWSAAGTSLQPANSWLVPYTGTYTITVTASCVAAAIWLGAAVLISGGTPVVGEAALISSSNFGGATATWTQALTGGVDYIQAQAACSAAATTDTTKPGRCPSMEISYTST